MMDVQQESDAVTEKIVTQPLPLQVCFYLILLTYLFQQIR